MAVCSFGSISFGLVLSLDDKLGFFQLFEREKTGFLLVTKCAIAMFFFILFQNEELRILNINAKLFVTNFKMVKCHALDFSFSSTR